MNLQPPVLETDALPIELLAFLGFCFLVLGILPFRRTILFYGDLLGMLPLVLGRIVILPLANCTG